MQKSIERYLCKVVVTQHECMDFGSDKEIEKLIELHVSKSSFNELHDFNVPVIPVNLT